MAQQTEQAEQTGKDATGGAAGTALKAAAAAAAAGAAAMAARKAFSGHGNGNDNANGDSNGSSRQESGSRGAGQRSNALGSIASGGWDAARDALLPALEDAAAAAGTFVAENGPDVVRERIVPRFIESFNEHAA